MKEPKVEVGILFEPQIEFILLTPYHVSGKEVNGKQTVTYDEGKILWNGRQYDELVFEPLQESVAAFELLDVTIGINFHWERKEDQRFQGSLKIIVENGKLTGINVIRVEDYLTSVISSEMSATASLELLKAHAVISRSWLLANLSGLQTDKLQLPVGNDTMRNKNANQDNAANCQPSTADCQLKWYERDSHTHFDVCADDHCQRYQGITRASTDIVRQAIAATRGQVLISEGKICDARFSKCCGGAFEEFQYCWEDIKYPYLAKQRDYLTGNKKTAPELPDLTQESEADRWIRTSPKHSAIPRIRKSYHRFSTITTINHRFLPLESRIYSRRTLCPHTETLRHRLRADNRPCSRGPRHLRTPLETENRRYEEDADYRERTGNPPDAFSFTPLQLRLCRRPRRSVGGWHPRAFHPHRSRMGTWRRSLPDRCCRNGRTRIQIR